MAKKKRKCLKCGIKFDSTGISNRICRDCRIENKRVRPKGVNACGRVRVVDRGMP